MNVLNRILVRVDVWVLVQVKQASEWLTEWLSISQSNQERALIVGYALCSCPLFVGITLRERLVYTVVVLVSLHMLWNLHRAPESERLRRMFSLAGTYMRTAILYLTVLMATLDLVVPPHHGKDLLLAASHLCTLGIFYLTSLANSGEKGKRRKLATDKVKEMFGTSWMPEPLPVPQ